MSRAQTILDELAQRGITARVDGEVLRLKPREALDDVLLARIREHKPEIIRALAPPAIPEGVRLVRWEHKAAPIALTRVEIVTDVSRFVTVTLLELKAALVGKRWLAGNRSIRELIDRLEECGVLVEVERGGASRTPPRDDER